MTRLKKILILTADAGFGHRSAANAIAAALKERWSNTCVTEIVNPMEDRRVPSILKESQTGYDSFLKKSRDLYRLGYETSDAALISSVVENALVLMLFEVMRDLIHRHRPNVVVTTYPLYQAPLAAYFRVSSRRRVPFVTCVTDLATVHRLWFHPAATWCLAPTPAVYDLALQAGLSPERVRITGIPVNPRLGQGTTSKDALRSQLGWQLELPALFVVGSRRVQRLPETLQAINHARLPLQLAISAGGDRSLYEQLQETEWHLPVTLYPFVQDMPKFFHASDAVICKAGGLIVTESLACGLPLLLIDAIPGQETGNAEYVVPGGAGELCLDPLCALETLFHWFDAGGRLLADRAANARRLGKPDAAYEVAELAVRTV